MNEDTITAISTAPGQGAIAVIRLSGPGAFSILRAYFKPAAGSEPDLSASRSLHHGWLEDAGRRVDEVMVSHFRAPNTYTGEDLVEISCHGSVYIQSEILRMLVRQGARIARPGEFTQRAFLNGKMDLAQAEAVADLIASSGAASHRLAVDQIRGGFSDELKEVRGKLLEFVTLIELELDFSEEDVQFADRTRLKLLVEEILQRINLLIGSFELGNAIRSGVPVAIAGETNVGKSTLLNALLKDEKAIVSEIAGTTRDSIEDCIHLGGIEFRFIDTAGIRETDDRIEHIGIGRSFRAIEKARIILLVTDASLSPDQSVQSLNEIRNRIRDDQQLLILINKTDLEERKTERFIATVSGAFDGICRVLPLSAKTGKGIRELEEALLSMVNYRNLEDSGVVVTNLRHYEALVRAARALGRTLAGLAAGTSGDFLSQDIRECMHYLGEITGQISNDEVLGNIFRNFCIGK